MLPTKKNSSGGFLQKQKVEAERLGRKAALSGIVTISGTALLTLGWGWWTFGILAGVAGLTFTGLRAWEWIQYRAKWGLKF